MQIDNLLIIPERDKLDAYIELADKYGVGFEYNDFFIPSVLDSDEELESVIKTYCSANGMPKYCTSHGAFLDVTIFSDDSRIFDASDYRVEQSLSIAERLGAKGVVFHTNYIPNFIIDSYRTGWVEKNVSYWSDKLDRHRNIDIYIENMFDTDCELLAELGERMKDREHFGICFDYAHAQVFGDENEIDVWVKKLSPYVKHMHINDNDFRQDLHLAVGTGKTDWCKFRDYYERYFSNASVLIEVRGMDKIINSLDYLSKL